VDDLIFQALSFVGAITSLICGIYVIRCAVIYQGDNIAKKNMIMLGIVNLLAGILFCFAVFHVDGFSLASPFAKYMRPLIILMEILPAFISHRMRYQ
jgi:uncharacterized membrane protein